MVELPLGSTLEKFIFEIGEGTGTTKRVKAVQTGGPSGGCIPLKHFNTPVDYESLAELGAIMGSGGMVVMDQDNCMVDVAKYFLEFTSNESCGKCTPCREGLAQTLAVLSKITKMCIRDRSFTTPDNLFTVRTVACFGQCAQSPVVEVDGKIHSNVNSRKLAKILEDVKKEDAKKSDLKDKPSN